mmetsp:Transcript_105691/g.182278  ORF Transcript_105691/g.182278 Transcript_105691/m.182278 type:complete len:85 (+) Transcript_105691:55-309(+)
MADCPLPPIYVDSELLFHLHMTTHSTRIPSGINESGSLLEVCTKQILTLKRTFKSTTILLSEGGPVGPFAVASFSMYFGVHWSC